jgi:hypothetical protein
MSNDNDKTHGNPSESSSYSAMPQKVSNAQRIHEDRAGILGNQAPAFSSNQNPDEIQAGQQPFRSEIPSGALPPIDNVNAIWGECEPKAPEIAESRTGPIQQETTGENLQPLIDRNRRWEMIVSVPLPERILQLLPAQRRFAVNPPGAEVETSALQAAFGLNLPGIATALLLRQKKSGTGVLGFEPDGGTLLVTYCKTDAQWYTDFAQHWQQRPSQEKDEKDRHQARLAQQYVDGNQAAIDEWNEFYCSIAAQFATSEQQQALEDFALQLENELLVEGLNPDQAHRHRSEAKAVDLETQIGGKLSVQATQGIFLDSLFWTYRQVQEICYFKRSLTPEELENLTLLFADSLDGSVPGLPLAVREQVEQWAASEYKFITGQDPENPVGVLWNTLRNAALMQTNPDIWNQTLTGASAPQIQSQVAVRQRAQNLSIQASSTSTEAESGRLETEYTEKDIVSTDSVSNRVISEFRQALIAAAIARLQASKVRLNSQSRSYTQDLSPDSRRWIELRSLSQQDQRLAQRKIQLEQEFASLEKENAEIHLFLKDSNVETPDKAKKPDPNCRKRIEEIHGQSEEIDLQIKLIEKTRTAMRSQFPAVGAVDTANIASSPNTQQTNEAISETLSKGFSDVRYLIDDLQERISQDTEPAMQLNESNLATLNRLEIGSTQEIEDPVQQVILDCLASEILKDRDGKWNEPFGCGNSTVGEMVKTVLTPTAIALLGMLESTTALEEKKMNDSSDSTTDEVIAKIISMNQAIESANSAVPETVRVNLVLGCGNILLSGLDAGLSSGEIETLSRLPILQSIAGSLSSADMTLLMRGLKAGLNGQMTAGLAAIRPLQQKLLDVHNDLTWLIRQAGKGGDMVYNAEGQGFQRSRPMEFVADRLELLQDRLGASKMLNSVSSTNCLKL